MPIWFVFITCNKSLWLLGQCFPECRFCVLIFAIKTTRWSWVDYRYRQFRYVIHPLLRGASTPGDGIPSYILSVGFLVFVSAVLLPFSKTSTRVYLCGEDCTTQGVQNISNILIMLGRLVRGFSFVSDSSLHPVFI